MTRGVTFSLRGVWNIDAYLGSREGGAFGGKELLFEAAPIDTKDSQSQKDKKNQENQNKIKVAVRDHRPTIQTPS